ncbi:VanZ family protein [Halovivax sp.]|uniref:VanZ family protein n=1 Tax=Halovivax sp. TaxID=1935978 RepID=UPI0025BCA04E|nr:VanZ family protein [Halovivax sp.]
MSDDADRVRVDGPPQTRLTASPRHPTTRWCTLLAVAAVIVAGSVATSVPTPPGPRPSWLSVADLRHVLAYATLAAALAFALPRRSLTRWRFALLVLVAVVIFGAVMELVQATLPHRTASVRDVGVNAIGAAVALVGYLLANRVRTLLPLRFLPNR